MLAHTGGRIWPRNKNIKGPDNDATDALSMLPLINSDVKESNITREHLLKNYCVKKIDSNILPLGYQTIDKYQHKYKELVDKLKRTNYYTEYICGGGNTLIPICNNYKFVVTKILQKYVVN